MKVRTTVRLGLIAASLCTLGIATQSVAAPRYTLDPGAFGNTNAAFSGDFLSGISSFLITPTATGSMGVGFVNLTSNTLNTMPVYGGLTAQSSTSTQFSNSYQFYASIQLTDPGTNILNSTTPLTSLNFQLYIDPQHDDSFTAATAMVPGGMPTDITHTSDDILVAFGTLIQGGALFDSQGGGVFNAFDAFYVCTGAGTAKQGSVTVAATDTTAGTYGHGCQNDVGNRFFASPIPFYSLGFSEVNNTAQGSQINGNVFAITSSSAGLDFNRVPEPSALALFGIAAVGLGLARRTRKH